MNKEEADRLVEEVFTPKYVEVLSNKNTIDKMTKEEYREFLYKKYGVE